MNKAKFEVFKSAANRQFYFRLKAENGEIVLSSEGYTRKSSCLDTIVVVKQCASQSDRYEKQDKPANHTFNMVARNGEIIGRSESYTTAIARNKGIEVVMKIAGNAEVVSV